MTAHDWLHQLRLQVLRLAKTAISPAARHRKRGKLASSRRDKIRFAPAAPQALEPRSLMTVDPTLDGPWAPSGVGANVSIVNQTTGLAPHVDALASGAMSDVDPTANTVGRPAGPSAANYGLASRPTVALTQPNPDFGRGSHFASLEHVSYGHPGNTGHVASAPSGVSSSTTAQSVHTAQHHGPLQPPVVASGGNSARRFTDGSGQRQPLHAPTWPRWSNGGGSMADAQTAHGRAASCLSAERSGWSAGGACFAGTNGRRGVESSPARGGGSRGHPRRVVGTRSFGNPALRQARQTDERRLLCRLIIACATVAGVSIDRATIDRATGCRDGVIASVAGARIAGDTIT